jgi:hypothetical protein
MYLTTGAMNLVFYSLTSCSLVEIFNACLMLVVPYILVVKVIIVPN